MKIAYQGVKGSFSHQTLKALDGEAIGLSTFEEVINAVVNESCQLGLLPIENSLAGCIYESIDLLNQNELYIVGEMITKVDHTLMGIRGAKPEKVLSHPKALAQCREFFHAFPEIQEVPYFDTAGAAREVATLKDPKVAAIASAQAAEMYNLEILRRNIQDEQENYTRFFILSKTPAQGTKCSLIFSIPHEPGRLAKTLQRFAEAGIDLTSIVSRPIKDKPFEYLFFVDIVLKEGAKIPELDVETLKNLGSYETVSNSSHCK